MSATTVRLSRSAALTRPERDTYATLPPPSTWYIQLRFQLCGFDVHRILQVPLAYTFANLHTLILFLFGWHGGHLHQSQVYSHVEMYDNNQKAGHMKKYGKVPEPPEWIDPEDKREMYFWGLQYSDAAIYRVVEKRNIRHSKRDFNDFSSEQEVEDQQLTLWDVWSLQKANNASQGDCSNTEIGISYEYDGRVVHITCDNDAPFYLFSSSSNAPVLVEAKGAPPIEDAQAEIFDESDPEDKTISPLLYAQDSFVRYCNGELGTRTWKEELRVFNVQEEAARREQAKKERSALVDEGNNFEDKDDEDDEDDEDYTEFDY